MTDVQQAGPSAATPAKPFRGPLRYDISTSSPQLTAGGPFSVFIKISNPYDVPAKILRVATKLPYEFCQITAMPANRPWWLRWRTAASSGPGGTTALHDGFAEPPAAGAAAPSLSGPAADLTPVPPGFALAEVMPSAESCPVPSGHATSAVLQPGNSIVHSFTFRTRSWLFFPPSIRDIHIQFAYEIDGEINQDSALCSLNVRAPLLSLIIGAALGSIGDFILKDVFHSQDLQHVVDKPGTFSILTLVMMLLGNILLGVILVIGLARKKDAQPFLSIEDFWGGLFIGVLAGYGGKGVAEQLLNHPINPAAGTAGLPGSAGPVAAPAP